MAKSVKSEEEKEIEKIFKKVKEKMQELHTYKPQFDEPVRVYAEMKYQYQLLNKKFYEGGCNVVEEYTNKAGATNMRKSALYLAIETMRKDLIYYENQLGFTPISIKKINDGLFEANKESHLTKTISLLEKSFLVDD